MEQATETTLPCEVRPHRGHPLNWLYARLKASIPSLPYLLVFVCFLELWHSLLTHSFSLRRIAIFAILGGLCLVYGRVFLTITSLSFKTSQQHSIQILCGFFVLNTLLFILAVATPFKIATAACILVVCGLLLVLFFPSAAEDSLKQANSLPNLLCLVLSGIGATLWCTDSLSIPATEGQMTAFPMWSDCFFHMRQISALAQAHGLRTLSDIEMAGAPLTTYHYASYVMPAAVLSFTKAGAYEIFASFMVPFGIVLTGLAAFSLANAIWGAWPGLAATVAVVVLPDAYQQGFGNKFLSYHFLQQVAPAGLYGVACAAIGWMFILDACKSGKLGSICFGYAFVAVSLAYKAHLFVANAFLAMIYPCLFFPRLRVGWRFVLSTLLTTLFVGVVTVSENSPSIPTLRLDGSAVHDYARLVLRSADPGALRTFFMTRIVDQPTPMPAFDFYVAALILIFTLGIWNAACPLVALSLRFKAGAATLAFPFFVVMNYLVMSLGLAFDAKKIGTPDELLHRPFVWTYFVVAVWTSGGIYALILGNHAPKTLPGRLILCLLALASIGVPLVFARGIQTMPIWGPSWKTNYVPTEIVEATRYIRKHSRSTDTVQDSAGDPKFAITGLTERQCYAHEYPSGEFRSPPGLRERLLELRAFEKMTTEDELNAFVDTHTMSWYILRPETEVAWPATFRDKTAFRSGGYRVYHFDVR